MEESLWVVTIKLTVMNYTLWRLQMEDLLKCKDFFEPLEAKSVNHVPAK